MSPKICFIRHAQALHNVASEHHMPDPKLSDLGVEQCGHLQEHLRSHWPAIDQAQLIVTSPLRRCLQTTSLTLDWLIERGVPVIARAEWQENANLPCDTGSKLSVSKAEFPDVDFSTIEEPYPAKTGPYAYTHDAVKQRGVDARRWLKSRPEDLIIVVTHSAFLRTAVMWRRFANADYRIFSFADEDPESVVMVEDEMTACGGMGRSERGVTEDVEGELPDEKMVLRVEARKEKGEMGEVMRWRVPWVEDCRALVKRVCLCLGM